MIITEMLETMYHAMRSAFPDLLTRPGLSKLSTSDYIERGQIFVLNSDVAPRWPSFDIVPPVIVDIVPPVIVMHPLDLEALREVFARDPVWRMNTDQAIADACCEIVAAAAVRDGTFIRWPEAWKWPIRRDPRQVVIGCQS